MVICSSGVFEAGHKNNGFKDVFADADPLIIRCFSHLRACQTQPDIFITVFQIKIIVLERYEFIWINKCDTNNNNTTNIFSKRKKTKLGPNIQRIFIFFCSLWLLFHRVKWKVFIFHKWRVK